MDASGSWSGRRPLRSPSYYITPRVLVKTGQGHQTGFTHLLASPKSDERTTCPQHYCTVLTAHALHIAPPWHLDVQERRLILIRPLLIIKRRPTAGLQTVFGLSTCTHRPSASCMSVGYSTSLAFRLATSDLQPGRHCYLSPAGRHIAVVAFPTLHLSARVSQQHQLIGRGVPLPNPGFKRW